MTTASGKFAVLKPNDPHEAYHDFIVGGVRLYGVPTEYADREQRQADSVNTAFDKALSEAVEKAVAGERERCAKHQVEAAKVDAAVKALERAANKVADTGFRENCCKCGTVNEWITTVIIADAIRSFAARYREGKEKP